MCLEIVEETVYSPTPIVPLIPSLELATTTDLNVLLIYQSLELIEFSYFL